MDKQKKLLGIIGHPVAHSLSPLMHNSASEYLSLPYTYNAFDVEPANLKKALDGMRAIGIAGINVTVPYKEKVVPFLDSLDENAIQIGAVNTITLKSGKLFGSNTDGIGFIRSLKKSRFRPRGKSVAMIGAGGSARAIAVSLFKAGISSLSIINRSGARGKNLVNALKNIGECRFISSRSAEALKAVSSSDLVIQTTSLGMKMSDPLPLAGANLRKGQYLYDIIYAPKETRFLKNARARGARTINGLGMLLYQGSESFKIWTGRRFPEEKVLKRLNKFLSRGT